jgi:hypothetical protein
MEEGDGFCFILKGTGEQEFHPNNLTYSFEEKFSLSGFFQRMDNFLEKGLTQAIETYRANAGRELAELETVRAALGQEFPQKDELALVRENHGAVMRELQRMQNEPGYVSEWEPKISLDIADEKIGYQESPTQGVTQAFKIEAENRFGPEVLNRVIVAAVPSPVTSETVPENGVLPTFGDFDRTLDTMADRKIWASSAAREAWKKACHEKIDAALAAGTGKLFRHQRIKQYRPRLCACNGHKAKIFPLEI